MYITRFLPCFISYILIDPKNSNLVSISLTSDGKLTDPYRQTSCSFNIRPSVDSPAFSEMVAAITWIPISSVVTAYGPEKLTYNEIELHSQHQRKRWSERNRKLDLITISNGNVCDPRYIQCSILAKERRKTRVSTLNHLM